ncbi:hypothetical protein MtrunA17_Chr3g0122731 [Medicago truncatula]|uniref:Uncharacterized protein n=1 Tax=Medicago truncatula TaxID=3880 RepID=A0A396IXA9_MEDTR|nr:hypothetical protein MtrunA17_Chr3g0122731 [Medicago truncatula]
MGVSCLLNKFCNERMYEVRYLDTKSDIINMCKYNSNVCGVGTNEREKTI